MSINQDRPLTRRERRELERQAEAATVVDGESLISSSPDEGEGFFSLDSLPTPAAVKPLKTDEIEKPVSHAASAKPDKTEKPTSHAASVIATDYLVAPANPIRLMKSDSSRYDIALPEKKEEPSSETKTDSRAKLDFYKDIVGHTPRVVRSPYKTPSRHVKKSAFKMPTLPSLGKGVSFLRYGFFAVEALLVAFAAWGFYAGVFGFGAWSINRQLAVRNFISTDSVLPWVECPQVEYLNKVWDVSGFTPSYFMLKGYPDPIDMSSVTTGGASFTDAAVRVMITNTLVLLVVVALVSYFGSLLVKMVERRSAGSIASVDEPEIETDIESDSHTTDSASVTDTGTPVNEPKGTYSSSRSKFPSFDEIIHG